MYLKQDIKIFQNLGLFSSSNVGKTTLHLISWPYRFGSNQNHWKAIAFSKTGLFWAHINHLKSDAKHFFNILCNRKKIFQIRYCVISHVKGLQSYHMSKFEFWKKKSDILGSRLFLSSKSDLISARVTPFFLISNFSFCQFVSTLS